MCNTNRILHNPYSPSVPLVLLRYVVLDNGLSCATFACKYRHFSKHFRCHCKSRKEGVRRLQCCSRQRNGFFKVTIERTFWVLWFSCFYDNFAYTLANAMWSAMCQNVLRTAKVLFQSSLIRFCCRFWSSTWHLKIPSFYFHRPFLNTIDIMESDTDRST